MIQVTFKFLKKHPFEIADRRRFASLACAGHTVQHATKGRKLCPVTNTHTKEQFTFLEALQAYESDRRERR